jgi:hypothetical protein
MPKKSKSKPSKDEKNKRVGTLRIFGALLVLYAIACFLVNFGIWHPWLLDKLTWLWNPLSFLTPRLVRSIPFISSVLAWIVNGVFAVIYSAVIFVIGAFAVLH